MMSRPLILTLACFIIVCTFAVPAFAISVSCSSGAGGQAASSIESFNLDDSTSLRESLILDSGSISLDRQAEGTGNNSLKQSLSGNGYTLQNNIDSQGSLRVSTSSGATAQAASLSQNVGAAGSMSLNLRGIEGATDAGQEASVTWGSLASVQSLSAGQGISANQSTTLEGMGGRVMAGALGKDNVVVARGSFDGIGTLTANLDSATLDIASARGTAALDGVTLLSDDSFKAVSSDSENRGMGMSGLRMAEGEIGNFDMSVLNMDLNGVEGGSYAAQSSAAVPAGGSYSSCALTGYRWNQKDPKVQLYLNPTGTPSGLTAESAKNAISAAANTWDDAVSQNIFADGTTVKIDYTKQVSNPNSPQSDGFNVNGWKNFGNSYLGLACYWSNGQKVDGYYSLTETDTWYNLDYQWTDDWNTAVTTNKMDLQSIAVHELGHGIGMGDLYTLPGSDLRKNDFAQVMNLYDGPQRTLGNGDKAGAQQLYGGLIPQGTYGSLYRLSGNGDHFYTINYDEARSAATYGYSYEGIAGFIYPNSQEGTVPFYRLCGNNGDHFYTTSYSEAQSATKNYGYYSEGIAGFVYPNSREGAIPLYRLYGNGDHFYTTNYNEALSAKNYGYSSEGIGGYINNPR